MRLSARDVLDRLRPAGSPGAAAPAGVPVDRRAGAAAELAPVFAALADVEDDCRRVRAAATAEAARRRQAGIQRAADLLARARLGAEGERAAAAAELRRRADTAAAELQSRADREAAELRERALRQRSQMVGAVLDRVRADLGAVAATPAGRPRRPR